MNLKKKLSLLKLWSSTGCYLRCVGCIPRWVLSGVTYIEHISRRVLSC